MKLTCVKAQLVSLTTLVLIFTLLTGCARGKEETIFDNKIKNVTVRFDDRTEEYENNDIDVASLLVYFKIEMESSEGIDDIDEITIMSPDNNDFTKWTFTEDVISKTWNADDSTFYLYCYGREPHELPLGKYTFEIIQNDDVKTSFTRTLYARGSKSKKKGLIYSNIYRTSPNVLNPIENIQVEKEEDDLYVSFTADDKLATHGILWLYDSDGKSIGGFEGELKNSEGDNRFKADISEYKNATHVSLVLAHVPTKEGYTNVSYAVISKKHYIDDKVNRTLSTEYKEIYKSTIIDPR